MYKSVGLSIYIFFPEVVNLINVFLFLSITVNICELIVIPASNETLTVDVCRYFFFNYRTYLAAKIVSFFFV